MPALANIQYSYKSAVKVTRWTLELLCRVTIKAFCSVSITSLTITVYSNPQNITDQSIFSLQFKYKKKLMIIMPTFYIGLDSVASIICLLICDFQSQSSICFEHKARNLVSHHVPVHGESVDKAG